MPERPLQLLLVAETGEVGGVGVDRGTGTAVSDMSEPLLNWTRPIALYADPLKRVNVLRG